VVAAIEGAGVSVRRERMLVPGSGSGAEQEVGVVRQEGQA